MTAPASLPSPTCDPARVGVGALHRSDGSQGDM